MPWLERALAHLELGEHTKALLVVHRIAQLICTTQWQEPDPVRER
jgi:hypothetical protein